MLVLQQFSDALEELSEIIPEGCIRKRLTFAGPIAHAHHMSLTAGCPNQEGQSLPVFEGDGIVQQDDVKVACMELRNGFLNRLRCYEEVTFGTPECALCFENLGIYANGKNHCYRHRYHPSSASSHGAHEFGP